MPQLLLADDDVELSDLLNQYLSSEGFSVTCVHDGEEAVQAIRDNDHDLLILDVMMPRLNGLDALREVRTTSQIPVLMLTAKGDDVDRIVGLEMGADDYLAKPCNPRELVARIRAILRRVDPEAPKPASQEDVIVGDLKLSASTRKVEVADNPVELTSTEFNVLQCLLHQAGNVVRKEELTEQVLERKLTRYDRSMDMHVSNLRKKLGPQQNGEQRIKTVRGLGYIYVVEAQ